MKQRNIALCVLFTIITCGIYGIYWMAVLTDETNALAPNSQTASGGLAVVFTIITCNIYGIYWSYKLGEKLDEANARRGLPVKNQGILYIILCIFGLGFINYCLAQSTLNGYAEGQ